MFLSCGTMSTKNFFFVEKAASFTCLVGSVLNGIFQLKSQSRIFIKSLFRLETETLTLFTTEKRGVSSANSLTSVLRPWGTPLM